jgi:hypothetical protein
VLIESVNRRLDDDLGDADRYVLGRIAEAYGFPETARDLYRHLARPSAALDISSYALAQRRLARLPAAPPAPAAGNVADRAKPPQAR